MSQQTFPKRGIFKGDRERDAFWVEFIMMVWTEDLLIFFLILVFTFSLTLIERERDAFWVEFIMMVRMKDFIILMKGKNVDIFIP